MKVTLESPQQIIVRDYRMMTLKQFVNSNQSSEIFAWIDGYLINFVHLNKKLFDVGVQEGIWEYVAVEIAPMPKFEETIQGRHSKISIFDNGGTPVMQAIIDEVKKIK